MALSKSFVRLMELLVPDALVMYIVYYNDTKTAYVV
jgi:hypothetical protein